MLKRKLLSKSLFAVISIIFGIDTYGKTLELKEFLDPSIADGTILVKYTFSSGHVFSSTYGAMISPEWAIINATMKPNINAGDWLQLKIQVDGRSEDCTTTEHILPPDYIQSDVRFHSDFMLAKVKCPEYVDLSKVSFFLLPDQDEAINLDAKVMLYSNSQDNKIYRSAVSTTDYQQILRRDYSGPNDINNIKAINYAKNRMNQCYFVDANGDIPLYGAPIVAESTEGLMVTTFTVQVWSSSPFNTEMYANCGPNFAHYRNWIDQMILQFK